MRGPHDLQREIGRDNMRRIDQGRTARLIDQPLHVAEHIPGKRCMCGANLKKHGDGCENLDCKRNAPAPPPLYERRRGGF